MLPVSTTRPPDPSVAEGTLMSLLEDWEADYTKTWEDLAVILTEYVERLHVLIRWTALAYNGAEPIWLTANLYGHPLPQNVDLMATWRGVIGTPPE